MTVATHDGVPDAVRIANAHFFGGENCVGRRLIEDPNMGQVWQTLMLEGRGRNPEDFEDRLNSLHRDYRMETWVETWAVRKCDLAERGCAFFGSVHGRGVIFGGIGGGKRADFGVELGWSPRQAV